MAYHFRSACWQGTHPDVCPAHARRIDLSGYVRRAAGTSKRRNSSCGRIWNVCCWRSFWPSGGWGIWPPRASITANATALTVMIAATRVSFAWGDSGSWISCAALTIRLLFPTASPFTKKASSGRLLYAFSLLFYSYKSVGERARARHTELGREKRREWVMLLGKHRLPYGIRLIGSTC